MSRDLIDEYSPNYVNILVYKCLDLKKFLNIFQC